MFVADSALELVLPACCADLPLAMVALPVADRVRDLIGAERRAIASAGQTRRQEFATGRAAAHEAMKAMQMAPAAVPVGAERRPEWPAGLVGSITHTREFAICCLARDSDYVGIGLDLENAGSVGQDVRAALFTVAERRRIRGGADTTRLFCAKEAVYKAINPRAREFVDFHDVEIDLAPGRTCFRARYLGGHAPTRDLERGRGCFFGLQGFELALFLIPTPAIA
jgi:4'-phosphopantetheinyl transferase EntD